MLIRESEKQLNLSFGSKTYNTVELTDGDSNFVWLLDQKYIYKEYFSPHQLYQESAGMIIFNILSSYGVPLILDKGGNYLVAEYIKSDSCYNLYKDGRIDKKEVAKKATAFIAEVYWKYRFYNKQKIKLFPRMSWEERLKNTVITAKDNLEYLERIYDATELSNFEKLVKYYKRLKVPTKSLTFLHRDIHLDNILLGQGIQGREKNYFIDFEHCMEGPVEYELQNSIFWNDDWSLPVSQIRSDLRHEHKVNYSERLEKQLLGLYYMDQVNIAVARNDVTKILKLNEIYKQRIK